MSGRKQDHKNFLSYKDAPASTIYPWNIKFWGKGGKKPKLYFRRMGTRMIAPLKWPKLVLRRKLDYRPIFIAGISGSGTSLITALIEQYFVTAYTFDESGLLIPKRTRLRVNPINYHRCIAHYLQMLQFPKNLSIGELRGILQRQYRLKLPYFASSTVVLDKAPNVHLIRGIHLAEAFPEATFILIFRHPVPVVTGLRKKWRLFGREPLLESINFYEAVYMKFLNDFCNHGERIVFVSYEQLLKSPGDFLEIIEMKCNLLRRKMPKNLKNKKYYKGKGLHNVKRGKIVLDSMSNQRRYLRCNEYEMRIITDRLLPVYEKMVNLGRNCEV